MTKRIFAPAEIESLIESLPEGMEVSWIPAHDPLPGGGADAVISLLTRKIGGAEMDSVRGLRVVANVATGFDNIDLQAAADRGVVVTSTPDVLTESTADLTLALILAVMRRLPEGISLVQRGQWEGWHPTQLLGRSLTGATLGVLGGGRIGLAVARRARGFGMNIVYTARSSKSEFDELGASFMGLNDLLAVSDCVTIHTPLNASTANLISTEQFAAMKPGAFLINTARGGIVDEKALLTALDQGRLAGAGLDVFDGEPAINPAVLAHPKIVSLPHIGSATVETRRSMAELAFMNVVAVLDGQPPITPVVVDGRVAPS